MSLLNGDVEAARDATQETALRFLSRLSQFRGDSSLLTWSMGIALNVAREMRRTRRTESLSEEDPSHLAAELRSAGSAAPLAQAHHTELQSVMRQILHELPERQREAIVLRFFQELSVDQTAAVMNCAPGTVKATVHQALRKL